MVAVTFAEAARSTGISRTQLLRLRDRGALVEFLRPDGLVELTGLREACEARTQRRANSFHGRPNDDLSPADLERIEALRQAGGVIVRDAVRELVAAGCNRAAAEKVAEELVLQAWCEFAEFTADSLAE